MEVDLAVVDDVCRHAGKGNGKVACEVEGVVETYAELLEQFGEILALDDTARTDFSLGLLPCDRVDAGNLFAC